MNNKQRALDIYLMGIGGTGMGAFAGLLKNSGHRVNGSDNAVYSPMKEKLVDWGIEYKTPYQKENLFPAPELVIVGNVIRRDNPEAEAMREAGLAHESFPSALNKLFLKNATSLVAAGTHGKTTCSALMAHTLFEAGVDPGFLVGGIPVNFGESFRASSKDHYPFVVEGDEYDTAYFDKKAKFFHYNPHFLLLTAIEFDHADIYPNLDAIINAFSQLLSTLKNDRIVIVNGLDINIKEALKRSKTEAKIFAYGPEGDYQAREILYLEEGISFKVWHAGITSPPLSIPLYGRHNLMNALGSYVMLKEYGLSHDQIAGAFKTFKGVKRRMEEVYNQNTIVAIDDFAHHPSAVRETLWAARQKYPKKELWAIFEPRSATSCMKIFERDYQEAFLGADRTIFAPIGRNLPPDQRIDCQEIASNLALEGRTASACDTYEELAEKIGAAPTNIVLLFMSNGNFGGILKKIDQLLG